ncbi:hypothetical protein PENTCL1PPCAC_25512 [Pristionchus entomophagus]|uniref:Uncharacterized protein n=1 Tax=Pristionchus entomophagus TaxID=358040 RepID=A0AAV5UAF0_9BILA|nr:hypothetical protein PENTCL1PPCAC_25512 [Pristionchus entomophagus]
MSSHPMLSNAVHARLQRKRIETRIDICAKQQQQTILAPVLTQQAIAAAVAAPNTLPTNRKSHHAGHHTGHHHVHHGSNTLMIGGLDKNLLECAQRLFARRILH